MSTLRRPTSDSNRSTPMLVSQIGLLSVLLYVVLLAGSFSTERAGLPPGLFVIPEKLAGSLMLFSACFLVAITASTRPARNGSFGPPLAILILFGWICTTSFWANPFADVRSDLVDFACMSLVLLSGIFLVRVNADAALHGFMVAALATGLLFSAAGILSSGDRASAFGGGPNVYARVVGMGLVALIVLWRSGNLPSRWLVVAPVLAVALILSGSRGGMLGFAAAVAILIMHLQFTSRQKVAGIVMTALASLFVLRQFGDRLEIVVSQRILELTVQQGDSSGRDEVWAFAWRMFKENLLFGAGVKSFAAEFGRGFRYPHNLVLQIAAEAGTVGLFLFVAALATATYAWWWRRRLGSVTGLFSMVVLILVASMFSGDYFDSRYMWVAIGMISAIPIVAREGTH